MSKALARQKGSRLKKPVPFFWEVQCAFTNLSDYTSRDKLPGSYGVTVFGSVLYICP